MLEFIVAEHAPTLRDSGVVLKDPPPVTDDGVALWARTYREKNKPRWSVAQKIPEPSRDAGGQVSDLYFSAALHFLSAVSITEPMIKANIIIEPPKPKKNNTALLDAWTYVYRMALDGARDSRWRGRNILGMALIDRYVRPSTYAIDRTSDIPIDAERHSYVATGKHERITLHQSNTKIFVLDSVDVLTVGPGCIVYIEGADSLVTVPQGTAGKITIIAPNGAKFAGIVRNDKGKQYRSERTIPANAELAVIDICF